MVACSGCPIHQYGLIGRVFAVAKLLRGLLHVPDDLLELKGDSLFRHRAGETTVWGEASSGLRPLIPPEDHPTRVDGVDGTCTIVLRKRRATIPRRRPSMYCVEESAASFVAKAPVAEYPHESRHGSRCAAPPGCRVGAIRVGSTSPLSACR
ncbi:hypothetical protein BD626DRAFT_494545 [Schizophyllum amplum]|uniref:Uncharacterized protein n=1 Tax=Schizophyllum amplum TaxID=97359 RepID=A0A550CFE0_9AGAR|nr:hypothetical protein BD626DRAFT_494545 [Auriculariopsis ampla]